MLTIPALIRECRWHNSSGTDLWIDDSEFDIFSRSKQKLYYQVFMRHVAAKHGYIYKKDFFGLPYDWRIGIQGLVQVLLQYTIRYLPASLSIHEYIRSCWGLMLPCAQEMSSLCAWVAACTPICLHQ